MIYYKLLTEGDVVITKVGRVVILFTNCEGNKRILGKTDKGDLVFISKDDIKLDFNKISNRDIENFISSNLIEGDGVVIKGKLGEEYSFIFPEPVWEDVSLLSSINCGKHRIRKEIPGVISVEHNNSNIYLRLDAIKEIRLATQEESRSMREIFYERED